MSTMKHDGKAKQQSLELPDSSISEKQNEELSFVLKIHDGHLHEVSASTIINLLSAFNQILGIKDALWLEAEIYIEETLQQLSERLKQQAKIEIEQIMSKQDDQKF